MEPHKVYFYTATILDWKPILFEEKLKMIILQSLNYLVENNALKVLGFVIMPNHIHLLWMPLKSQKFSNVQLSFMRFTSQQIKFFLQDNHPEKLEQFLVNKKDRTYQIWQRNPHSTEIYSRKVCEQKLDYIHNNPVQGKWMLANSPINYYWSSSRYYDLEIDDWGFISHYMDHF